MGLLVVGTGWGLAIALSLIGWGWLVLKSVRSEKASDWGWAAPVGLASWVGIGGILNAASLIGRPVMIGLVAVGCFLGVVSARVSKPSVLGILRDWMSTRTSLLAGLGILGLVLFRIVASVHSTTFNLHDDLQGYFVFPLKMLQTGSLGLDPFSERRLVSSLGGAYFLDALPLTLLPVESLHLIDPGVNLVLLLLTLSSVARARGLGRGHFFALAVLLLLTEFPHGNITSTLGGCVVLLALFRWVGDCGGVTDLCDAVILGLLVSGACALKSSFIVPAGVAAVMIFIPGTEEDRPRPGRWLWLAGSGAAVCVALLGPWMWSLHRSSGTFLYPVLGKGFDGTVYGDFAVRDPNLLGIRTLKAILVTGTDIWWLALGALFVIHLGSARLRRAALPAVAAVTLGMLTMGIAASGYGLERYSFPATFAAVLLLLANVLGHAEGEGPVSWRGTSVARVGVVLCALLIGSQWDGARQMYQQAAKDVTSGLMGRTLARPADAREMRTAQARVPAGATILARVSMPFLLDFSRNRIFIADYPGGASPPPGLPLSGSDAHDWLEYFRTVKVRYILFSYGDMARFTRSLYADRLKPEEPPWIRSEARRTFEFQDAMMELKREKLGIYDDGFYVLLDVGGAPEGTRGGGRLSSLGGKRGRAAQ